MNYAFLMDASTTNLDMCFLVNYFINKNFIYVFETPRVNSHSISQCEPMELKLQKFQTNFFMKLWEKFK